MRAKQDMQFSEKADIQHVAHIAKSAKPETLPGITLPINTGISHSPYLEKPSSKRKQSFHPKSRSDNKVLSCCKCHHDRAATKEHGTLSVCENCGARFYYEHTVVCTEKGSCPCYRFGAVDRANQESSNTSKESVKGSSTGAKAAESISKRDEKELQVLLNLIYGFSESLALSVRTAHYALSIAKKFLKYLQSKRLGGKNDRRKRQLRRTEMLKLASASLLISCRHNKSGITLRQISKETNVSMADIVNRKKEIEALMGKKETVQESSLFDVLDRACNMLKLPLDQINAVQKSAEAVVKLGLSHCSHDATVVAGCIYLVMRVADANCSRKKISEVTCVSWYTIRKFFETLLPNAERVLPEDFRDRFADCITAFMLLYSQG